jgi:hypothetical protein
MKMKIALAMVLAAGLSLSAWLAAAAEEKPDPFATSLHATTDGMAHWYDAHDGFGPVAGIPYKDLTCKGCHVGSCNDCHLEKTENGYAFTLANARKSATCLKCHAREQATIGMDKERNTPDVHMTSMVCADCHSAREIHGDGVKYDSMRQPGAMDAKCANCHAPDSTDAPAVPGSASHTVHKDRLACNACHVQNSMACYNCHFGVLKATGDRSKSAVKKLKDFILLVKYQGQVTSGTMQTMVSADNKPFVAYVPYFTHSVTREGRKCEQCHQTEAVLTMAEGKVFSPGHRDTKSGFYEGVIPVVPELLTWPYFEQKDGKWVEYRPGSAAPFQMAVYAEPFTADDLKKMSTPSRYRQ